MRVRMRVALSGMRNGQEWPPAGSVIDLPDQEAIGYVSSGMADPVTVFGDADTERAVLPPAELREGGEPQPTRKPLTTRTGPGRR